jgi:hypothetical protein
MEDDWQLSLADLTRYSAMSVRGQLAVPPGHSGLQAFAWSVSST